MRNESLIETLSEKLTVDEVKRRYPNQWVGLIEVEVADMQVTGGVLRAHSPTREEIRDLIKGHRKTAVFWTGARTGLVLPG